MERTAARRWADQLAAWAIDPAILAAAPESPYGFPAALWAADRRTAEPARSIQAARDGLPVGGSVIDIGCGGGAGTIPLADVAGRLVGVDESAEMLASYERAAAETAVPEVATVRGTWPDVAPLVETADVVVAANVVYNVPDIVPFVLAAHERARHRVVMELTVAHPQVAISPLWQHFHGQERPAGPRVADFVMVLAEIGIQPVIWRWDRPSFAQVVDPAEYTSWVRRRLCLPYEREPEVAALLAEQTLAPTPVATVWWDSR
jgi:SAM-dependent methyltransferase